MPIFKTANSKGKYRDLKAKEQVIGYIMNPAKTPHGFCGGSMVDTNNIAQSMNEVSEKYGKTEGVQCRHFIISFNKGEIRSCKEANIIAEEIVYCLGREYQAAYAVHEDSFYPHIHIVMNPVSFQDGHRYHGTKKEHHEMMESINRILRRHNAGRLIYMSNT